MVIIQNPRFIIESGFKSRAGYNGARTVYVLSKQLHCNYVNPVSENFFKIMKSDKIFCSRWLNPICITVDQLFNKDEKLTVSDLHSLSLEDGTK